MHDPKHHNARRPYHALGSHLRYVREQNHESVAEVSGAVEIDTETLQRYEDGRERPSEDILMLLINHFDIQDQEAVQLWESAGYESEDGRGRRETAPDKPTVVLLAMDMRTMYSDGLDVDLNKSGLVLNFTQGASSVGGSSASGSNGSGAHRMPVAKVGMSYDQAQQVLLTLQHALLYGRHGGGNRQLPPGDNA